MKEAYRVATMNNFLFIYNMKNLERVKVEKKKKEGREEGRKKN